MANKYIDCFANTKREMRSGNNMANTRQDIKNGYGKPLGWIETDERGNKRVYSFSKGLVGFYYKDSDRTCDTGGRLVAFGDCTTALLFG